MTPERERMVQRIERDATTGEWMPSRAGCRPARPIVLAMLLFASFGSVAVASTAEVPKYFVAFDASMNQANVRLCLDHAARHVEFSPDSPRAMRYLSEPRRSIAGKL